MKRKISCIIIAVLLCLLIGFISSIVTQTSLTTWYANLKKPWFNPPNWVFAPVWILLYLMIGSAAGIIWSQGFHHKWVKTALYHFGFQLLLNAAWSIFFFGLENPLFALLDIIALFILLLFTIKRFKIVSRTAAYLLAPYTIWIAFAMALNFKIWQLN